VLGESRKPIMAKLELPEVLDRLDEILRCSDGVMIARGDLAVEVPFEQVPGLQARILQRAAARGMWAAVATQMLRSMVRNPRPSRAEVTDVAHAVATGADAIMLSEETATGDHPVRSVEAMNRIALAAEQQIEPGTMTMIDEDIHSFAAGAANAAVHAAARLGARAIVALAGSGLTALALSKWRPPVPVLALSAHGPTLRRLNVLRGVTPVGLAGIADMEQQLARADRFLLEHGWAAVDDVIVAAAAVPMGQDKSTNTIRFHRVRAGEGPGPGEAGN
jgi:pyruvate kinase